MKPTVPPDQKSQTITFSLKPDLFRQMLARVEQLGYPWTRSSYVVKLVQDDLTKHSLWPLAASGEASDEEVAAFIEQHEHKVSKALEERRKQQAPKRRSRHVAAHQ